MPEIDKFFDRFQYDMLTEGHLMPLLFSFNWPRTTLVLHCAYTQISDRKGEGKSGTAIQWPLHSGHDRAIIPYCLNLHWKLFDVDLNNNLIRYYDSLGSDPSLELVEAIKRRLTYAEEDQKPNRNFTVTVYVRMMISRSSTELKPIGISTSAERN